MLAGGVGYGTKRDCLKKEPQKGNKVVVVGGDNYRIGLGGGSVSSVDTGRYSNGIELNAVQRANPEMQKRAYNLVRALCEEDVNPVVSIHDHGSAGHLNCLSELVEECGGEIRDRMGGGVGSWPIAGTAVYMTAYPRLHDDEGAARDWEDILPVRQWLYQTPQQILTKASNGASDFGNKFGQPLICGSVLTIEHQ